MFLVTAVAIQPSFAVAVRVVSATLASPPANVLAPGDAADCGVQVDNQPGSDVAALAWQPDISVIPLPGAAGLVSLSTVAAPTDFLK
jgi:hypothetical protein